MMSVSPIREAERKSRHVGGAATDTNPDGGVFKGAHGRLFRWKTPAFM
jgi:hypothetical protein